MSWVERHPQAATNLVLLTVVLGVIGGVDLVGFVIGALFALALLALPCLFVLRSVAAWCRGMQRVRDERDIGIPFPTESIPDHEIQCLRCMTITPYAGTPPPQCPGCGYRGVRQG